MAPKLSREELRHQKAKQLLDEDKGSPWVIALVCFMGFLVFLMFALEYYWLNALKLDAINSPSNWIFANNSSTNRDCFKTKTACLSDSDCTSLCLNPSTACVENFCAAKPTEEQDPNCNLKHGIVPILAGVNSTGAAYWVCKSTYPHIYSDQDQLQDLVCDGGSYDPDFTISFDPRDCKCAEDKVLIFNSSGVPRCVTNARLFPGYVVAES